MLLGIISSHRIPNTVVDPNGKAWVQAMLDILSLPSGGDLATAIASSARFLMSMSPNYHDAIPMPPLPVEADATTIVSRAEELQDPLLAAAFNVSTGVPLRNAREAPSKSSELRGSLSAFPTLQQAAFPVPSDHSAEPLTAYRLLENALSCNARSLFGWQPDLRTIDHVEGPGLTHLPTCSGLLSERFSIEEGLDYRYYLRQGRPTYAFELAKASGQVNVDSSGPRLSPAAASAVYDLAMDTFFDRRATSACLLFLHLAYDGATADSLRDDLAVADRIFQQETQQLGTAFSSAHTAQETRALSFTFKQLHAFAVAPRQDAVQVGGAEGLLSDDQQRSAAAHRKAAEELLNRLERGTKSLIRRSIGTKATDATSYAAGQLWSVAIRFCRRYELPPTEVYLVDCARNGAWVPFLVQAASGSFSSTRLLQLVEAHFSDPALRAHLSTVVRRCHRQGTAVPDHVDDQPGVSDTIADTSRLRSAFYLKAGVRSGEKSSSNPSPVDSPSRPQKSLRPRDLSQSSESKSQPTAIEVEDTEKALGATDDSAQRAGERVIPVGFDVMDVVFACINEPNAAESFLVASLWYEVPVLAVLGHAMGAEPLLCACYYAVAAETAAVTAAGFLLPAPSSSDKRHSATLAYEPAVLLPMLLSFLYQRGATSLCIEILNVFDPDSPLVHLTRFCHAFKEYNFTKSLSHLSVVVDRMRLSESSALGDDEWLRTVVDVVVEGMLSSSETEYGRMHLLKQLADVQYDPRHIRLYHTALILTEAGVDFSTDDDPAQVVDRLLELRLYDEARAFSQAHGASEDSASIAEVWAKINDLQGTELWESAEVRIGVFRQCYVMLKGYRTSAKAAGNFFLTITKEIPTATTISTRERVILLEAAAHWLNGSASCSEAVEDSETLQRLQDTIWGLRVEVEAEYLRACFQAGPDRAVDPPTEESLYETQVAAAGVRGWGTAESSEPEVVAISAVPSSASHDTGGSPMDGQERQALDNLICRLLVEGRLHQAHLLATQFCYQSQDVVVVQAMAMVAHEAVQPTELPGHVLSLIDKDVGGMDTLDTLRQLSEKAPFASEACRRIIVNFTVVKILNMTYGSMLSKEALRVLKFLLLRGPEHHDLARSFISCNRLNPEAVTELLSTLFVGQPSPREGGNDTWMAWDESTFARYAT